MREDVSAFSITHVDVTSSHPYELTNSFVNKHKEKISVFLPIPFVISEHTIANN